MPYANQKAALVAMNIVPCTHLTLLDKVDKIQTELDKKSTKTDLGVTQCTGKYIGFIGVSLHTLLIEKVLLFKLMHQFTHC